MLIDIIKMPPLFNLPISREITLTKSGWRSSFGAQVYHIPSIPLYNDPTNFGSNITRTPEALYKAIHVSGDNRYVFETVFTVEKNSQICLYTKIISTFDVRTAISLRAIAFHQDHGRDLVPIAQLVGGGEHQSLDDRYSDHQMFHNSVIDNLIPPIFGYHNLLSNIRRLNLIKGVGYEESRLGWIYKPIYDHEPGIMVALMDGVFKRSPLNEISHSHPGINISKTTWFKYHEVDHAAQARGIETHINHEAFDNIALALIDVNITSFNITCVMSHALENISTCWLIRDYDDIYRSFIPDLIETNTLRQKVLTQIFYNAMQIYIRLYNVDIAEYSLNSADQSSVTITKNIHDEVTISFHNAISGSYICFYTSFSSIVLTTLGVGDGEGG